MHNNFSESLLWLKDRQIDFSKMLTRKSVKSKTTLLYEGDVSNNIYFIKKGVLRLWHNKDGEDVTFQFFVENQPVASFESFAQETPSNFSIESLEDSELLILNRKNFKVLQKEEPQFSTLAYQILAKRFIEYTRYFLSRIEDDPATRYKKFKTDRPDLNQRIPDYYIASYLGISPVSLSQIRHRI